MPRRDKLSLALFVTSSRGSKSIGKRKSDVFFSRETVCINVNNSHSNEFCGNLRKENAHWGVRVELNKW